LIVEKIHEFSLRFLIHSYQVCRRIFGCFVYEALARLSLRWIRKYPNVSISNQYPNLKNTILEKFTIKNYLPVFLKGMAMGIAEVIPGVSGGTIAFITGIYERFIGALQSIDFSLFKTLKDEGVAGAWRKIDGNFLAALGTGMVTSVISFVSVATYLIDNQPVMVWAFFFGLISASITIAAPTNGSDSLGFIFLSGMIAISAMLLPGLSGSFILLLMGMYSIVWGGLKNMDFAIIITFAAGCIAGILSFSKALNWAFQNHKSLTLSILTGFIIGSLNRVWPWQEVLSRRVNSKGEEVVEFTKSILPGDFANLDLAANLPYGNTPQIMPVVGLMIVGFATVFLLERVSRK